MTPSLPSARSTAVSVLLLGLTGCGIFGRFSDERQVCEAYLECAADAIPDAVGTLVGQYGSDSGCWDNRDQAELCTASCQSGAAALIGVADDPTSCQLAAAGTEGGECMSTLTEAQFEDRFLDRLCVEAESCSQPDIAVLFCDPEEPTGTTGATGCTFVRERACACLDATYECNRDNPGFEYIVPPQECLDAYDCPG